MNQENN